MRLYILIGIILACVGFLVYKQRQLKIKENFTTNSPYHGRYIYYMADFMYENTNKTFVGNKLYPENSSNAGWNNYVNALWTNRTVRYADPTEIDYYNKMGGFNWTTDGTLVGTAKSPVQLVSSLIKPNTHFGAGYGQANVITPNGTAFYDSYSDVYVTGYNNQTMFLMRLSSKKENSTTKFSYIRMHDTPATGAIVSGSTQPEVYHITGYQFTYNDAKNVCTQLGATLATEAQLTTAFNNGAQWCSWGWVNENKAMYPMQIVCDGCGSTGTPINTDTTLKYGINVFGKKPPASYKSRYNDIKLVISPFYRQECGPVVDPDVYYMYKDATDGNPGRLPPNTVYQSCPASESSTNITQDCYNQIWAAKCTASPQTVNAGWSLEYAIDDTKAWATNVTLNHRKGCYGNDPARWPAVTQADRDMVIAQQKIIEGERAMAAATAAMAAAKTSEEYAAAQLQLARTEASNAQAIANAAAIATTAAVAQTAEANRLKEEADAKFAAAQTLYNQAQATLTAANTAQAKADADKAAAAEMLAAAMDVKAKAAAMEEVAKAETAAAKAASDRAIAAAEYAAAQTKLAQDALAIAILERQKAEAYRNEAQIAALKAEADKLAAQKAAEAAALDVAKVEAERAKIQQVYEETKLIELNVQNDRVAIDTKKAETEAALKRAEEIYQANLATKKSQEELLAKTEANRQLALQIQETSRQEAASAEQNRILAEKAAADAKAALDRTTVLFNDTQMLADATALQDAQKNADLARIELANAQKAAAEATAKARLTALNAENAAAMTKAIEDANKEAANNKAAAESLMRQAAQQAKDSEEMLKRIQDAEKDAEAARQNSINEYNKLQDKIKEAEQIRLRSEAILVDAQKRKVDAATAAAAAAQEAANAAGQLENIDKSIAEINKQIDIIRNATSEAERQSNIANLNAILSTLHAKQAELATQTRIKDNEEITLLQAQQAADEMRKKIAEIEAQIKKIDTDITNARNQPDFKVNTNAKLEKEAELARLKEVEALLKVKQTELEAAKQQKNTYNYEASAGAGAGAGAGANINYNIDNSTSEDPCSCLPDISDSDISSALEQTWDNVVNKLEKKAKKEGFMLYDRFTGVNSRYQMQQYQNNLY